MSEVMIRKIALVTGGGSGIGEACAKALAAAGASAWLASAARITPFGYRHHGAGLSGDCCPARARCRGRDAGGDVGRRIDGACV